MARKRKEEEKGTPYDVLIGYVRDFKYKSEDGAERMSGHPFVGRLYRILQDPYGYRIHIGRENNSEGLDGLFLGTTLEGEHSQYTFRIEIVTPENYIDFDLVDEDREKLIEWVQNENKDLWDTLRKESSGESPVIRTGVDMLKLLLSEIPTKKKPEEQAQVVNLDQMLFEEDARTRALEATLTLLTHYKSKQPEELATLFDLMYSRIYNTLKG